MIAEYKIVDAKREWEVKAKIIIKWIIRGFLAIAALGFCTGAGFIAGFAFEKVHHLERENRMQGQIVKLAEEVLTLSRIQDFHSRTLGYIDALYCPGTINAAWSSYDFPDSRVDTLTPPSEQGE